MTYDNAGQMEARPRMGIGSPGAGGMAGTGPGDYARANQAATQKPRILAAAENLGMLVEELAKVLEASHVRLDSSAGPGDYGNSKIQDGGGGGGAISPRDPSSIAQIEDHIARLRFLVRGGVSALHARIAEL